MAHTQIWDSSYENIPADNDQASEGALRIRNLKRDIRERIEIDHDWDDVTDAGKHLQVSFRDPLGAKPTAVASEGYLYTKDVSAKAELFYEDEDGNEIQLSAAGVIPEASLAAKAFFPATTAMLFQQTAAPTGWTKGSTHNNKGLRLQTGTVTTGGGDSFTTVFGTGKAVDSHVLVEAEVPAHTHTTTLNASTGAGPTVNWFSSDNSGASNSPATNSFGGDGGHVHNISDLDLQFVDVILAVKD